MEWTDSYELMKARMATSCSSATVVQRVEVRGLHGGRRQEGAERRRPGSNVGKKFKKRQDRISLFLIGDPM